MSKDLLSKFKRAIERIAKQHKVHPREVQFQQFIDAKTGISKWSVSEAFGGFAKARDKAFPPEPGRFKETASMDVGHELSRHIATVMEDCAEELGMPPHELQWHEFRRWINFRFGTNDCGIAKHSITRAGGFNAIKNSHFLPIPTKVMVEKKRLVDQARMNSKLGAQMADQQFVMDRLEEYCSKVFKKAFNIQVCCKQSPKQQPTKRILNLILSDLHFGSDIDKAETGYQTYGRIEEARRFAHVCKTVCEYKMDHREETELRIGLLGDLVQNQLHDSRDGAVLAEQIARAIHVLVQGLGYLCSHFVKVTIYIVPGNHDRNYSRHKSRAVHQKWDSYAFVIGTAIKYALIPKFSNLTIEMPKTPYVVHDLFGKKAFLTHGDSVLSTGYVSKSISVGALESQINRMNAALPDKEEYAVAVCGHIHVPSVVGLGNGTTMITNGALVPADSFAISIGLHETRCCQTLFESTDEHPVGDIRFIDVGPAQDKNSSLDSIIEPWSYNQS